MPFPLLMHVNGITALSLVSPRDDYAAPLIAAIVP